MKNVKILVVEDDRFLSKVYYTKLTKDGFDVILAVEGDEAIRKVKEEKPDVILLDLILPGKNGFEVLEEIKADDEYSDIPVVIMSNLGQEKDIERGRKLGAVDYLVKTNYSINDVISKIKEYVVSSKLNKKKKK